MTALRRRLGIWAAAAALILCAGVVWLVTTNAPQQFAQRVVQSKGIGQPFNLTDHNGNPITEKALAGSPSAVFFGFTHCPEVCPTTLYEMASWLNTLGPDGKSIKAFFITVDPERDTPEIMKSYVSNFTDRIVGITGKPADIAELAKSWHVYWKKIPLESGDYTMDHTASVFLIDAKGNFKSTIAFRENTDTAVAKLRKLASP
ncbi:SCO family protein [Anderseniella sp. Alg231-50]|uniref:SCO family protein n=1 Tax=Anderseniella sp. Alg231-50 TaxID=1922226 RepID=UPI000D555156